MANRVKQILSKGLKAINFRKSTNENTFALQITDLLKKRQTVGITSAKAYDTIPLAHAIIDRYVDNVIGSGLQIRVQPKNDILNLSENILKEFTATVEGIFQLWAQSKDSSLDNIHSLQDIEKLIFRESLIYGDVLIVLSVDNKTYLPKIQIISSSNVVNPSINETENEIQDGVELDAFGKPLAYYVTNPKYKINIINDTIRIPAYLSNGMLHSFLLYRDTPPIGKHRGTPLLEPVLEDLCKLNESKINELESERINSKLALIMSSKGKVNIPDIFDGGENSSSASDTPDVNSNTMSTVDLPSGSIMLNPFNNYSVESFDTKRPNVNFGEFANTITKGIGASVGIPVGVLDFEYQSNYTASRGSIVDFNTKVKEYRKYFVAQFLKPIYHQFLLGLTTDNSLTSLFTEYLNCFFNQNLQLSYRIKLEAWESVKFTGVVKPHIDPIKETNSYIEQVENGFISREDATEALNGSDYYENTRRLQQENEKLAEARKSLFTEATL